MTDDTANRAAQPGTPQAEAAAADYVAFLSYNHRDAVVARRLQRRLESYRLPRGMAGPDGGRRLGSVFRDRDDLPAAADLSQAVRAGIARSRALVVLCSPHAASSIWVEREIRLFRATHPDRPVLAAIVAGDPADAFPPALREGGEPLAADLRPEGDGPRLGLLKLVAGLGGVGLDRLVQRDAQRRIRRVTGITAVALVVMLCLLALSILAWQAQREAERQRSEAEGLVEFMLTDLRQRLHSVGRLDALAVVNRRAMAYYRDQGALDRLPEDSLERRARVLHAMGEDDIDRGDLPAALHKFEEAHRTTAALLAKHPDDPERLFVHAQSEFWVGYIDQMDARPEAALAHYRAYHDRARRLLVLEPHNPRSFAEIGYALSNIASVQWLALHDYRAALGNYEMSLHWFQRAAAADPRSVPYQREVAERHAWISDVLFSMRNWGGARWHRQRQIELLEPLRRADPRNGALAYDRLVATRALGRIAYERGEHDRAAAILADAQQEAEALRRRDPENQSWFEQQLRVLMDAADTARARARPAETDRLTAEAHRLLRTTGAGRAANPAFRAASIRRLDAIARSERGDTSKGD